MIEMTSKELREDLLEFVEHEGKIRFALAPIKRLSKGLPGTWRNILGADDPVKTVLEELWFPWRDLLPETIAQLEEKLQYIGLLQTNQVPFSLVYVFEDEEEPIYSRGYPCQPIERDEAEKLPNHFLDLYKIHNGWTDIPGPMGWLPSEYWFDLGVLYEEEYSEIIPDVRLKDFLVICNSGGSGFLGFDLSKSPPVGLLCSEKEPVQVAPDVVRTLDEWMADLLEDLT